jgi:autotransporter-associated beta strand protein
MTQKNHPVFNIGRAKSLLLHLALVGASFVFFGLHSAKGQGATWLGGSGSWDLGSNWSTGTVIHDYNATATFTNNGNGNVSLARGVAAKGIIFTTNASAYELVAAIYYLELENGGFVRSEGTGANSQIISQSIALRGAALSISSDYTDSSKTLTLAGPIFSRHNATSTLTLNGGNTGANIISGAISNNNGGAAIIAVAKSGTGNWILSGSNSYTGTTQVTEGALMVTGTHSGGGAYTVSGSGTLGGAGGKIITASGITLGSGGKLNISGAGLGQVGTQNGIVNAGTLELESSLDISLAGTESLVFVLGTPESSDHVKLSSGTLTIGNGTLNLAAFKFDITSWSTSAPQGTYTLFTADSILGDLADTGLTGVVGGYNVQLTRWTTGSGEETLQLTVIPEPATLHILALGLAACCVKALRRKKA